MAYTVFARKYRPQTFEELIGQEHVARTLANAIEAERVAHAFLFTGVRGVGKTTTARLLAKALNCEQGPTPTPCNVCAMCRDITAGVDIDVQEIDGASNNSVEDVRRLQESLPFRPARDRFKVVIVDEVHMLSTGAFNAFLKTLEEPPSHVKFIFATTESHKVPVTIKSRCQRYDFRLIPQAVIAEAVKKILAQENVTADTDTVALVAREAAGSMRDALTLLDQLVAFGGETLVGAEVSRHLGIAGRKAVHDIAGGIVGGDAKRVLEELDQTLRQGAEPVHFVRQLLQLFRDLVVLRVTGADDGLVDLVAEEKDAARTLANGADALELQRVFAVVAKLVDEVANASSPRIVLEMGLVRAATRPPLRDVAELLARLERLEKSRGGGSSPAPRGGGRPRGGSRGSEPRRGAQQGRSDAERTERRPDGPRREERERRPEGGRREERRAGEPARKPARAESRRPAPEPPTQEPPKQAATSEPATSEPATSEPATSEPATSEPATSEPAPLEPVAPSGLASEPSAAADAKPPVRRTALLEWENIVSLLRDGKPALAAVLEHGVPRVVTQEKIVLSFQEGSFYGRQAQSPASTDAIASAAEKRLGTRPIIEIRFDAGNAEKRTVAAVEATRKEARTAARRREALSHPAVRDAMDVFPASRGKVEVRLEGE
ncbi:MAG: DNA polymerase III subunit gamma/tau [Myxococcota bacterium]